MNILVIGNGFDLAHGLPTKYEHFLVFCEKVKLIYTLNKNYSLKNFEKKLLDCNFAEEIKGALIKDFNDKSKGTEREKLKTYELYTCINDNFWFEYFISVSEERNKNGKDGWIDFESEISKIVQSLDNDIRGISGKDFSFDEAIVELSNEFLNKKFSDYTSQNAMIESCLDSKPRSGTITYREIRDILLNDLNRLTRALEIYLTEYVQGKDCKKISPDIQQILSEKIQLIDGVAVNMYIKVLSFNYTNTFQRVYLGAVGEFIKNNIDYIHGEANFKNTIESNNMVLGIDEYLSKKRRSQDTEFIAFKKYYQRIYKGTGCKYKEWVDRIKESWESESEDSKAEIKKCISKGKLKSNKIHNLYIFGHSLDDTDKDILRDLILNDNVHTTIFYHNKEELGRKIANLVKVIGQDELIRRTGGSTRTIEFQLQQ